MQLHRPKVKWTFFKEAVQFIPTHPAVCVCSSSTKSTAGCRGPQDGLHCIIRAILQGYMLYGIRTSHSHPIIAVFCAFIPFAAFAYCGVYHRAHRMSFMQRQIRKGLQSTGGQLSNLALRMEMTRAAVNLQCPLVDFMKWKGVQH